jgi:MFS family permease
VRRIPLGALQEREFRLFFTGQMVSLLGDAVTPFALAWAVLDLTGSARDLGFVIAAKTAPLVVFLLAGGVFADRLPRRGVMLTADVARMAIQAATAALLLSHTARIWELIVLQAFAGTGTAFFNPASTGLTPMTVSAGRLQEANALRGMSMASMQFIGPALAVRLPPVPAARARPRRCGGGWDRDGPHALDRSRGRPRRSRCDARGAERAAPAAA